MAQEANGSETLAKRSTPFNVVESDPELLAQLDALSSMLGIDDLSQEDATGALQSLDFVSTKFAPRFFALVVRRVILTSCVD